MFNFERKIGGEVPVKESEGEKAMKELEERYEGDDEVYARKMAIQKLSELKGVELGVDDEIEKLMAKLEKMEMEGGSHFHHIIGQLDMERGFAARLEKERSKERQEGPSEERSKKIKILEYEVAEHKKAVQGFVRVCLADNDFFAGELKDKKGYFGEAEITRRNSEGENVNIKINDLGARDFIVFSAAVLVEKKKQNKVEEYDEAA